MCSPHPVAGGRRIQWWRPDWRWSSTRAHLRNKDDGVTALRDRFPHFAELLASEQEADLFARLERLTRRSFKPGKRGRNRPNRTGVNERDHRAVS
jgi:putative transposase